MVKIKAALFTLALVLVFTSCNNSSKITNIDMSKEIKEITISTKPANKDGSGVVQNRSDINKIVNYLNSLRLKEPKDNADDYVGMTYAIKITYTDDTTKEYIHFGNRFFKESTGVWREMEYKQAEKFEDIYNNL